MLDIVAYIDDFVALALFREFVILNWHGIKFELLSQFLRLFKFDFFLMHFLNDNFLHVLKVYIWSQFLLVIPSEVGSCKIRSSHRLTHSFLLNGTIIVDRLAHLCGKLVVTLSRADMSANELINPHSIDDYWLPRLIEIAYLVVALLHLSSLDSLILLGLKR